MIAIVACAVLILAWLAAYAVLTGRPKGQHARPHEGRHEPDPLCPACRKYICVCGDSPPRGAGRLPYVWDEDEADAGWWTRQAPGQRVEVLTGPHARIAQTSELTLNVLARVRDALPGTADDPCDTGEFAALLARGRVTPAQEADRLASKYLPAPEAAP